MGLATARHGGGLLMHFPATSELRTGLRCGAAAARRIREMKMRKNDQLESFVNYRCFMHARLRIRKECYTIIEFFVLASGNIFRQIEIYHTGDEVSV